MSNSANKRAERETCLSEVADYLAELANHVTEDDAKDLPKFLRVLAERVKDGEIITP